MMDCECNASKTNLIKKLQKLIQRVDDAPTCKVVKNPRCCCCRHSCQSNCSKNCVVFPENHALKENRKCCGPYPESSCNIFSENNDCRCCSCCCKQKPSCCCDSNQKTKPVYCNCWRCNRSCDCGRRCFRRCCECSIPKRCQGCEGSIDKLSNQLGLEYELFDLDRCKDQNKPSKNVCQTLRCAKSIELRNGKLYRGCDCRRRNGLQDKCQRWCCINNSQCRTSPPSCRTCQYSLGQHLKKSINYVCCPRKLQQSCHCKSSSKCQCCASCSCALPFQCPCSSDHSCSLSCCKQCKSPTNSCQNCC